MWFLVCEVEGKICSLGAHNLFYTTTNYYELAVLIKITRSQIIFKMIKLCSLLKLLFVGVVSACCASWQVVDAATSVGLKGREVAIEEESLSEEFTRMLQNDGGCSVCCANCGDCCNPTQGFCNYCCKTPAACLRQCGCRQQPCFSGSSTVQLLHKGLTPLKDIHVGDYILVEGDIFEEVYAFAHFQPTKTNEFLQIHTTVNIDMNATLSIMEKNIPLEITVQHLVFLQQKPNPIRADSIQVGDILRGNNGKGLTVTRITKTESTGLFVPLTKTARPIIGGIVVSSYVPLQLPGTDEYMTIGGESFSITLLSHHDFVHMALSPYRVMCMAGNSKWLPLSITNAICHTYNEDGAPYYIGWGMNFIGWIDSRQHVLNQAVGLTLVLIIIGILYFIEFAWKSILIASSIALLLTRGEKQKLQYHS